MDDFYRELRSRGAETLNEPKDYPYGMRDFDVNDIDGNQLCFGMAVAQQLTPGEQTGYEPPWLIVLESACGSY